MIYTNYYKNFKDHDELCHYGVLGMRWGVRRANKYLEKANRYRSKSEKYDPNGERYLEKEQKRLTKAQYKKEKESLNAEKYESMGNSKKADKYRNKASMHDSNTEEYRNKEKIRAEKSYAKMEKASKKAQRNEAQSKFVAKSVELNSSRSFGARAVTRVLGGPLANHTYSSIIAAGGTKGEARAVTAANSIVGRTLVGKKVARRVINGIGNRAVSTYVERNHSGFTSNETDYHD